MTDAQLAALCGAMLVAFGWGGWWWSERRFANLVKRYDEANRRYDQLEDLYREVRALNREQADALDGARETICELTVYLAAIPAPRIYEN